MTPNKFRSKLTFPTQGTTGRGLVTTNKFLPKLTFPTQGATGGGDCDDKEISAEIDVPYSGYNGENCDDNQISADIDVPYSGYNGGGGVVTTNTFLPKLMFNSYSGCNRGNVTLNSGLLKLRSMVTTPSLNWTRVPGFLWSAIERIGFNQKTCSRQNKQVRVAYFYQ